MKRFSPSAAPLSHAAPAVLGVCALFAVGCGDGPAGVTADGGPDARPAAAVAEAGHEHGEHDHSGWWCGEHGIPEGECTMCSLEAAAAAKAAGDWCAEHDRAESQCFLCDPSRAEKFAATYRAKYGEEPPPAEL